MIFFHLWCLDLLLLNLMLLFSTFTLTVVKQVWRPPLCNIAAVADPWFNECVCMAGGGSLVCVKSFRPKWWRHNLSHLVDTVKRSDGLLIQGYLFKSRSGKKKCSMTLGHTFFAYIPNPSGSIISSCVS